MLANVLEPAMDQGAMTPVTNSPSQPFLAEPPDLGINALYSYSLEHDAVAPRP